MALTNTPALLYLNLLFYSETMSLHYALTGVRLFHLQTLDSTEKMALTNTLAYLYLNL